MSSLVTSYIHTPGSSVPDVCVCVCVASVTCVRGQEKGTMRSSPGRAQGLGENKMTEGHMEEERAHTREDTWTQKNHIQTLPAEAGDALPLHHPLLSDLRVSTDRRGSSENQLFTKTTSEDESWLVRTDKEEEISILSPGVALIIRSSCTRISCTDVRLLRVRLHHIYQRRRFT